MGIEQMKEVRDEEIYYGGMPRREENQCLKCIRLLLMFLNALIALAAIGAIVFGILGRNRLEETLKTVCPECNYLFWAYITLFALLFLFSLLGFFALCTRGTCLRVTYALCLFLVCLVLLSFSVLYILVADGTVSLAGVWNRAAERGDAVCAFERRLNCSGWTTTCHESTNTITWEETEIKTVGKTEIKTVGKTEAEALGSSRRLWDEGTKCPRCSPSDQSEINLYNTTCEEVVSDFIQENMRISLGVGFGLAGVTLIIMIVTCMVNRKEYRQHRGGYYYRA